MSRYLKKKVDKRAVVIFLSVSLVLVSLLAYTDVIKTPTIPKDIADKKYCGNRYETTYQLENEERTTFIIPDAYIGSRNMRSYIRSDREAGLYEFIYILFRKDNLLPVCTTDSRERARIELYHLNIKPYKKERFHLALKSSLRVHPNDMGEEMGHFRVYTNDYRKDRPWERRDILVPLDNVYKDKLYIECVYGLPSGGGKERVGCSVNAITDKNYY
ncbi:MAG: hypothetical protein ACQEQL_02850, partial [Pseudomonadota bacterium]